MALPVETKTIPPAHYLPGVGATEQSTSKWQIIGQFSTDFAQLLDRRKDAAARTEIELRVDEACAASHGQFTPEERAAL